MADDIPSDVAARRRADWRRRVGDLYAAVRADPEPQRAWRAWRDGRDRLLRDHPASPIPPARRGAFLGLPFHDYDPGRRFVVATGPAAGDPLTWDRPDGAGIAIPVARTRGLAATLGGELTLYWTAGAGGGLLLPFGDTTNGLSSFTGGRYLLDGAAGADLGERDDRLILDFNFAHDPPCSYLPGLPCALAPRGNRLPVPVRAGEMM